MTRSESMDLFSTIYLLTPAAIGLLLTLIAVTIVTTAVYSKRTHTRVWQTIVLLTIPIVATLFFHTLAALLLPTVDIFTMLGISVYPFGFLGHLLLYTLLLFCSSQFYFLEMNVTLAADRIIHTMPDPLLVCDHNGSIQVVNDAFSSIFGYEPEKLINRNLHDCPNYDQMGSLMEVLKSANNGSLETSLYDRDNNLFPAHISASHLFNRDGSISGTIFVIQDVREYRRIMNEIEELYHKTEEEVEQRTKELQEANCSLKAEIARREQIEEKLRHTAFHDALTGLPNRELFSEHLQHAFNKYKHRGGMTFAILFIDLDHFKFVNDTYGHIVGDFVLKETARRLHDCMRDVDTVGRLGGDEFVILMDDISEPSQTIKVAERILDSMHDVIAFNGTEIKLGSSIGIAFAEQRHEAPKEIIRDADIALYHAKQQGKHRYSIFQGELQERAIRHMKIEHALRETVRRGEFDVQYQPIVELSKGKLKGFEALIRWKSSELGQVSPETFIPIAEESELIFEIGRWVLYRACNDMSNWLQHLPLHLQTTTISVNVSPRQLQSPDILRDVENALAESMLPPPNLVIEVTESAIITDAKGALQTLTQLKEMGVKLHLDDFGEGYSSLSMLYRFPFDTMKIDRSYVSGLHNNHDNSEVVRTIINLGHSMKKEVIAEGIETSVEATALRNFKCELGQGFFFSKPMDEAKALTFIKSI